MNGDATASYAAESSFWILIAFIPFVMFLLTLLQTIRIENTAPLFAFAAWLPKPIRTLLHTLLSEIRPPSGLLSTTAVFCVWTASNGTLALMKGLFSVFDVPEKHRFFRMRLLAIAYTLALAAVLTVSFGLFLFTGVTPVLGGIFLLSFFWLLFSAVSRKKMRARYAFIGALCSAVGWCGFSFFFSVFVENFANYSTLYGSLAAVVIFMMWLYFCMYIFLIGGEIAMWLQNSPIVSDLRTLKHARRRTAAQKGNSHGKKTSGR